MLKTDRNIRPQGYKTFLFSTQLSTKFQLHIKAKIPTNKEVFALSLSNVVFSIINVKMQTILTFMSVINFVLRSELSMEKVI